MVMKKLAILFVIIVSAGCSSSIYFTEQKSPVVKDYSYLEETQILGISKRAKTESERNGETSINYFLRSFINKSNSAAYYQVYIQTVNKGVNRSWGFYKRATLESGKALELIPISRDVSCSSYSYICTFTEVFAVNLPPVVLYKPPSDLSLKVYSKSGSSFVVDLTDEQISAQLQEVRQLRISHALYSVMH